VVLSGTVALWYRVVLLDNQKIIMLCVVQGGWRKIEMKITERNQWGEKEE